MYKTSLRPALKGNTNVSYIQSRAEMNFELIDEYAAEMKRGVQFEAAKAINADGHIWIYDGAHRYEAAKKEASITLKIECEYGTRADAEWLSLSANQRHGLRRSRADKQRVVKNALLHANAANLSDREIGRHCGVDHKTVGKLRKELELSKDIPQMDERTVTRSGKTFTQAAKAEPEYMSKADIEQSIQAWLKDRPPELHLEILADIARKNEDGQRYYGSILKAMPLVYIEANVWTTCLAMLDQLRQAKAEPKYTNIFRLERGVRAWLNSKWHKAPKVHIEVLGDIKNKAVKGPVRLQELVNGDLLPGPRRKRDVVQACNNVLDQMTQTEIVFCVNCGEGIKVRYPGPIKCPNCHDEWANIEAFEQEKAAYKAVRENITPIPHAKTCPLCKSTVYYGISACIECHNCTAYWPTEEAFLADVETETQETTEADRDAETQAAPPANQPTFARVPCPKCNEMKIEIKAVEDSVLCHSCDKTWTLDTFHKERMAPRMTSAQPIAEMPAAAQAKAPEEPNPAPDYAANPDRCDACAARDFYEPEVWVKQYTQHICPQCLRELGKAMINASEKMITELAYTA